MRRILSVCLVASLLLAPMAWAADVTPAILSTVQKDAVPMGDAEMMQVRGMACPACMMANLGGSNIMQVLVLLFIMNMLMGSSRCPSCG